MCCLKYEQDYYSQTLKKLPKAQKELLCRAWSAAGGPFSGA